MAALDALVTELDRSYADAQERMSDPTVYNDHREAAEVGRRLKELEGPYKLAQEWRSARDDLEAAREDADLREVGLTSLDMVDLVLSVECAFDVRIPEAQITPANFRSIAAIDALLNTLRGAQH